MASIKKRGARRKRVGRVSYYYHHGGWHVYYRDGRRQVRRRVADTAEEAERIASQVNAQVSTYRPTLFGFVKISVAELRQRFLDHHEHVLRSSLATVDRYRTATKHLEDFAAGGRSVFAHEVQPEQFLRYLRSLKVPANGHSSPVRRPLRDKGLRFILEACRSLYGFAAKQRHLPPYAENPFAGLGHALVRIENAKPVFVFDEATESAFFRAVDNWSFPLHFTLAKTGMQPGELMHLLVEDVDPDAGWLHVRNKPELGWRSKTGRVRTIPLVAELVAVLRRVIGSRTAGPVFVQRRFNPGRSPLVSFDQHTLVQTLRERMAKAESELGRELSRSEQARMARAIWRDMGAVTTTPIRNTFVAATKAIGHPQATCPKSWRHSFATLLQDANVDPLIRQITLGHKPRHDATGSLGMTAVYTHTRAETQKREIERALRLWPGSLEWARTWAEGGAL
jgi:integrase